MKKIGFDVTKKCHYRICRLHISEIVFQRASAVTENDIDTILVLNLGIKEVENLMIMAAYHFLRE